MIERDESYYVVRCDSCGDSAEYNGGPWQDLMDEMKADGWKNTKRDDEWEHYCPECSHPGKAFE